MLLLLSGCGSKESSGTKGTPVKGQTVAVKETECASCHEMSPEVYTWQVSSHSQIDCTVCHKVQKGDFQKAHDSGSFSKPIKLSKAIGNGVCESCHSNNRVITASGDIIIPHKKHVDMNMSCTTCHAGVAHAKVSQRESILAGELADYEKWTPESGQKVMTVYYTRPDMWTCLNCHKGSKTAPTKKCNACHSEISSLASHEQSDWLVIHGKNARENIGNCSKCHATPDGAKFVTPSTGDLAADFARANTYCYSCHTTRPKYHQADQLKAHPGQVPGRGINNCFACHDKTAPSPYEHVTGTYCNQCHWFEQSKQKETEAKPATSL